MLIHSQKLPPLGETHGIIAILQPGILGQLAAHHGNLCIHVQKETILCVLEGDKEAILGGVWSFTTVGKV